MNQLIQQFFVGVSYCGAAKLQLRIKWKHMMIQPRDFSHSWVVDSFPLRLFSFTSLLAHLSLSLPSVRDGIPAAGDFLLPEPRRSDRVRGHLPARLVRGFKSGKRSSQPRICYFTNFAKTQGIQKTWTVSSAEACVLLTDIVHHQYM